MKRHCRGVSFRGMAAAAGVAGLLVVLSAALSAAACRGVPRAPSCGAGGAPGAPRQSLGRAGEGEAGVIESIFEVPSGRTNILYFAGMSNGVFVIVHETGAGLQFWNLRGIHLDKAVRFAYTDDRSKWIVLKADGEPSLRHWDMHGEIEDFIRELPLQSAIAETRSEWFGAEDEGDGKRGLLGVYQDFVVRETLSPELRKGDLICVMAGLFDGDYCSRTNIAAQMRKTGRWEWGRRFVTRGLWYISWEKGKFMFVGGPPEERAFCINEQIAGPFRFAWECVYDDLLPFDEDFAVRAYVKRVRERESHKGRKGRGEGRNEAGPARGGGAGG